MRYSLSKDRFLTSSEGSVVPIFAFLLVALCCTMGAAIDYLRSQQARVALQNAIDATVLTLAATAEEPTSAQATQLFQKQLQYPGLLGPKPIFTFDADGTVTGSANMSLATLLLRLANFKTLPVTAHAKAMKSPAAVSDKAIVNFEAMAVKGWFAKDIYAFVRDKNGDIVKQVKVLSHDWDEATGKRTITPPIDEATADFVLSGAETFGVMMRVWPSYPGSGSSRDTVPPIDYYSDDPSPRIKTSGDCRSGEIHKWEDAPNDADRSKDDYRDFVYVMTCKEMPQDVKASGAARLVE